MHSYGCSFILTTDTRDEILFLNNLIALLRSLIFLTGVVGCKTRIASNSNDLFVFSQSKACLIARNKDELSLRFSRVLDSRFYSQDIYQHNFLFFLSQ